MSMTWEEISKQPKEKHNSLVKLYAGDLVQQCIQEHEVRAKTSDEFLDYMESSEGSAISKAELGNEVEKFVKDCRG